MNRYRLIRLLALAVLALALPLYALREPGRMARTLQQQQDQYVADAADIYLQSCVSCHGTQGQGTLAIPALNDPALASADFEYLYQRIAHAPHGTSMAIWHVGEGGALSGYQAEALVTLIRREEWGLVDALAQARDTTLVAVAPVVHTSLNLAAEPAEDPHACATCHEEPDVHANRFGLDCARCHAQDAWIPALLTGHTFALDHGGAGTVECQVCHTANYADHTCYGCHDHQPEQMATVHPNETRYNIRPCVSCHPTGSEEIDRQMDQMQALQPGLISPVGH